MSRLSVKRVKQEHFDFWTDEHRWDPLENNGKTYVPTQFLLRSVDTGRRMCNVGASTTSGISRSYRDVDLETNEARVVEFPPRKQSTRRQEDEHDGFGNFIACALRRMAHIDMRRARTLSVKLLAVVQEEESSVSRSVSRVGFRVSDVVFYSRFIAHGTSYAHLSGEFAVGRSTACPIAREVAHAIVDGWRNCYYFSTPLYYFYLSELHDLAFPIPTLSTWRNAEEQFCTQWDYPAAMGALDGKQIACVCPSRSGSSFFNYKGHYSIVLLALVHANYRCILYDLGLHIMFGRSSDAGEFMTSPMKTYIEEHDADFPSPVQLGHIGKAALNITPRGVKELLAESSTVSTQAFKYVAAVHTHMYSNIAYVRHPSVRQPRKIHCQST
ncbi:unnamed protein product [Nippostrongylus brasiliensis]|uniref:DDE Tnp4 domain-containing protein n=1 Tax=Nippostrongylus brasiliensis TaxID=27835 RepID=A0A0N4XH98_NIPBR|nr:unnamed protein product [Nippostrongylus brasiliensis]